MQREVVVRVEIDERSADGRLDWVVLKKTQAKAEVHEDELRWFSWENLCGGFIKDALERVKFGEKRVSVFVAAPDLEFGSPPDELVFSQIVVTAARDELLKLPWAAMCTSLVKDALFPSPPRKWRKEKRLRDQKWEEGRLARQSNTECMQDFAQSAKGEEDEA